MLESIIVVIDILNELLFFKILVILCCHLYFYLIYLFLSSFLLYFTLVHQVNSTDLFNFNISVHL